MVSIKVTYLKLSLPTSSNCRIFRLYTVIVLKKSSAAVSNSVSVSRPFQEPIGPSSPVSSPPRFFPSSPESPPHDESEDMSFSSFSDYWKAYDPVSPQYPPPGFMGNNLNGADDDEEMDKEDMMLFQINSKAKELAQVDDETWDLLGDEEQDMFKELARKSFNL
jgi:hypothetical protein